MPALTFKAATAQALLREQAQLATPDTVDSHWEHRVAELSHYCEKARARTHIAFLGTAMLAKALDARVNLYQIKHEHADEREFYFCARTLCEQTWVVVAPEIGVHLGVTSRQPLNNSPYGGMRHLEEMPMRPKARVAFGYMLSLVDELGRLPTEEAARQALRAFIVVRRRSLRAHVAGDEIAVRPEKLADVIADFVAADSEHGRRAQAAVAGLMDVFARGRVAAGRIHDPSRKWPGDVCIRSVEDAKQWEKAIEVRDKPVSEEDVRIFAKRCIEMGVREAAVVCPRQSPIDVNGLYEWAGRVGIGLTLFCSWRELTDQVLFWSALPKPAAAVEAAKCIEQRLFDIEVSDRTLPIWRELCAANAIR